MCVVQQLLRPLLQWPDLWTARHGGLLGLKYSLAARTDIRADMLHSIYADLFAGMVLKSCLVSGIRRPIILSSVPPWFADEALIPRMCAGLSDATDDVVGIAADCLVVCCSEKMSRQESSTKPRATSVSSQLDDSDE